MEITHQELCQNLQENHHLEQTFVEIFFFKFLPIGDLLLSLEAEFGRKFQSRVVLSVLISETSENMKYVEPHLGHDNNSQVKLKLNVAFSKSRIISSHF